MTQRISRRTFLRLSAAGSIVWAGWQLPASLGLDQAAAEDLFRATKKGDPSRVFPASVASGDPRTDGVTLWTCLARDVAASGHPNQVAYEIAADSRLSNVLLRGIVETDAGRDYTVKTTVSNSRLKPASTYYYRFIFDGQPSRVGRFRTLPAPDANVSSIRFAYISCQDYSAGYYTALAHLAQEELDFVVHLGDYIYETTSDPAFQDNPARAVQLPGNAERAETLADYRHLYRVYKSDPNLQAVHERFTFINIWDDHEFANDAYGIHDTDSADAAANRDPDRRQAASQAWAEFTPTAVPFDEGVGPLESLRIYRSFVFGNLVELVMTDERLYRDGPPCGLQQLERYLTPLCSDAESAGRTMLGAEQKAWFLDRITGSTRTWKLWGNEVMAMQLKLAGFFAQFLVPGAPAVDRYLTLDQWDGYRAERSEILRTIRERKVNNFVTLTGDLHTFLAGYLREDFDNLFSPSVGVCFVGGSVTSSNFSEIGSFGGIEVPPPWLVNPVAYISNPHLAYINSEEHGYSVINLTHVALTCEMKTVSTIKDPVASLVTRKMFLVPRDRVDIRDITPPVLPRRS